MKREIKFRAWHNGFSREVMYQWGEFEFNKDEVYVYDGTTQWKKSEFTLMQFTGLKDKNGKEIYEGDIVRLLNWEPQVYEVLFDRGAFCFRSNSEQDHNFYNDCKYLEESAVIGNIYENSDLIN